MLNQTVSRLRCPTCGAELQLFSKDAQASTGGLSETTFGELRCLKCGSRFPILAGVAILVDDVGLYLCSHVKGISQVVPDSEIPGEFLSDYLEAKADLAPEHIEEDLESERVTALYLVNHYLHAKDGFFSPLEGAGSPLIRELIQKHWDQGPFAQIAAWTQELPAQQDTIELACGLGGLLPILKPHLKTYLGVDSSFASIALARHLTLGVPYAKSLKIPADLLAGSVSREVTLPVPPAFDGTADFVVGDFDNTPAQHGRWELSIALNAIDMIDDPTTLPRIQRELLRKGGTAIQSCPYIWHQGVAAGLREILPATITSSSAAVEYLYETAGFRIEKRIEHLPWLFYKHLRQLEIYSVHLFSAKA